MLLSLFCGAGGLDLGFEQAGFEIGLAYDKNPAGIRSYNHNRNRSDRAFVADVTRLDLAEFDRGHGSVFRPDGVIGGPPCQSFSNGNVRQTEDDPRHRFPMAYVGLIEQLNARHPVSFCVMENVVGLTMKRYRPLLESVERRLDAAGFNVARAILDAKHYGVPQTRERLFLVGLNRRLFNDAKWRPPMAPLLQRHATVRDAIAGLPAPAEYRQNMDRSTFPHHPNHWCMKPRSPKFDTPGKLREGYIKSRSFKTLAWDLPSITVAYGHREVHVHPEGQRRLSIYEAMQLQGFPHAYELTGSLSSQITQVSEAVPPPLARAIATSLRAHMSVTETLVAA